MWRIKNRMYVLLAFLGLLSACQATNINNPIKNIGPTVKVLRKECARQSDYHLKLGELLILCLPENSASIGYSWHLSPYDESVLKLKSDFFQKNVSPAGLVGAGGIHIWHFQANRQGRTLLIFKLLRPWEGEGSTADIYQTEVVVN